MKLLYLIFVFLITASEIFCQGIAFQKAQKHFDMFEYKDAAGYYEMILKKENDRAAVRNLAYCYLKLNDMPNAEKWLAKTVGFDDAKAEEYLYYAQVLEANKKYDDAKKWFDKYNSVSGADKRGKRFSESLNSLSEFYADSGNYKIVFVNGISSSGSDFSPVYYKNGITYVSERNHGKYSTSSFMWDESHYLDLYYAEFEDKDFVLFKKEKPFSKKLNTKYHEGPFAMSKDEKFMVFTRNNYYHKKVHLSGDGVNKLKLFYNEFKDDKWQPEQNFPYNNDNYSCGHPALTADGKTMYFVSDMPGTLGGTDVWISKYENNTWTKPVNAGPDINTEGNEMFPTLIKDSVLYVASNGFGGLGGLDIFAVPFNGGKLGAPKNMGYPINTNRDDFGLIYDPKTESGYFSSNRENKDGGSDDIYFFKVSGYFLTIKVIDEVTKEPIPNSVVKIKDSNGKTIEISTDEKAMFKTKLGQNSDYEFVSVHKKYFDGKSAISSKGANAKKDLSVLIPMGQRRYRLIAKVTDAGTKQLLPDVNISLYDKTQNDSVFISSKTNNEGFVTKHLDGKVVGDKVSFKINLDKDGFLKKNQDFDIELGNDTVIIIPLTLDRFALGIDVGKIINLNPIYFDLNKWNIRPDAAAELDKIVTAMNENPSIVIELGSHTDCRATATYNLRLSDKRAKSSAVYIISKGISKSRIYGKGYGESKLINDCVCEGKIDSGCSEEEHQMNRRTEFKIVKIKN